MATKEEQAKPSMALRVRQYLHDVSQEVKKTSWPDSNTLLGHTLVVIVSVALLGVFVGLSDVVLHWLLSVLVP
jgi:preprotein translocase SecE subunit